MNPVGLNLENGDLKIYIILAKNSYHKFEIYKALQPRAFARFGSQIITVGLVASYIQFEVILSFNTASI